MEFEDCSEEVENLVVLNFGDGEVENAFVVVTEYEQETLQRIAEKIRAIYELIDFNDWTYLDVVKDMQKLRVLEVVCSKEYYVRL